mgnify:CR=1 FL=1
MEQIVCYEEGAGFSLGKGAGFLSGVRSRIFVMRKEQDFVRKRVRVFVRRKELDSCLEEVAGFVSGGRSRCCARGFEHKIGSTDDVKASALVL